MKQFNVISKYSDMILDTYNIKAISLDEAKKKAKKKLEKLTGKNFAEQCEYILKEN